jgi:hypothetical protein
MADRDPYRYLPEPQKSMSPPERAAGYNNGTNGPSNVLGLAEGGANTLTEPMLADMVALVNMIIQYTQQASSAANLQEAWVQLTQGNPRRSSASQIVVDGYWVHLCQLLRAVRLEQTSPATGWISAAEYNSGTGQTTITLDCTVDAGFTELWLGQDVDNAPKPQEIPVNVAQALYFSNTFMTS